MLRFGPATGPVVVVALPLFEEANRTRAFAVTICRALAKRGVASVLPDLPGQGESLLPVAETGLALMRPHFKAVASKMFHEGYRPFAVSIRSGMLLDAEALVLGRWHLAPQDGDDLLRDLGRIKGVRATGDARIIRDTFLLDDEGPPIEVAGNLIGPAMLHELFMDSGFSESVGAPIRTVRLDTDPKPADRHVPGPPLWRRAEPDNDPALAALLADDIADWIAACEG